ncbi:MAG: hypothetical protein LC745_04830, partial [Planctomycetia bacterium]|nr:hypothetical protein [Planctomycetia bacterium]
VLGFGLASPCPATRRLPALGDLGKLTLAVLLPGTLGGFGEVAALYVTTKIRCYNRLSIFIAFFSLFALAVVASPPGRDRGRAPGRAGWGLLALLWGLTALGLLAQIPSLLTPDHARDAAAFSDDRAFFTRVERSVPPGSMICQLPPNWFPEFGRHFRMYGYSHFRGSLHTRRLRWSFGALRGRETEAWQSRLAPMAPGALVDALVAAGFAGIYVDRKGHEGDGQALVVGLLRKVPQEPITNGDGFPPPRPAALPCPGWRRPGRGARLTPGLLIGFGVRRH